MLLHHREASATPRMIEHPVLVYMLVRSLLAEALKSSIENLSEKS